VVAESSKCTASDWTSRLAADEWRRSHRMAQLRPDCPLALRHGGSCGRELKKAVESCVQHDLEPTNQARRCASLDRGLHETAGMLGA
jgi:hypothetical protein